MQLQPLAAMGPDAASLQAGQLGHGAWETSAQRVREKPGARTEPATRVSLHPTLHLGLLKGKVLERGFPL